MTCLILDLKKSDLNLNTKKTPSKYSKYYNYKKNLNNWKIHSAKCIIDLLTRQCGFNIYSFFYSL